MKRVFVVVFILLTPFSIISSSITVNEFSSQEVTDLKEKGFLVRNNDKLTYINNQMQKVWEQEIAGLTGSKGFIKNIDEKIIVIQFIKELQYNIIKINEINLEGAINEFLIPLFSDIEEIITCILDDNHLVYLAKHNYPNTENFILGKVSLVNHEQLTKFIDIKKAKEIEYVQLMQMIDK